MKTFSTKMILSLTMALMLAACSSSNDSGGGGNSGQGDEFPIRLEVPGSFGLHGIFDPSLAYDSNNDKLYMSFSAVDSPNGHIAVTTRLASSLDGGKTWIDAGLVINDYSEITLPFAAPADKGVWQHEVSSIEYDANQNVWRMFYHTYLDIGCNQPCDSRRFEHGWLAYKEASTPEGLENATAVKFMVGNVYDTSNNNAASITVPPIAGAPLIDVDNFPALSDCAALTEAGIIAKSTALYLSFLCAGPPNIDMRVVMLKCDQPCDVANTTISDWDVVASWGESSASAAGYSSFSAPDLFAVNGEDYLVMNGVINNLTPDQYAGCVVYKFSDIATGGLTTNINAPVAEAGVGAEYFNGACTYHEQKTYGGMIYSRAFMNENPAFRLFFSGVEL